MAQLQIETSDYCPDSTYFRTGEVEPDLNESTLTIYSGQGTRRGWGRPQVTSTAVLTTDDLAAVHVGFSHKHGGGQFWRFYVPAADGWSQVRWSALSDEQRQRVLDASRPAWAKAPGKLRSQRTHTAPYSKTVKRYKIVALRDGQMISAYDGETVYEFGAPLTQTAKPDHAGGYYVYEDEWSVLESFANGSLFPGESYLEYARFALLEVECAGACMDYGWKEAWSRVTPIRILRELENPQFNFERAS